MYISEQRIAGMVPLANWLRSQLNRAGAEILERVPIWPMLAAVPHWCRSCVRSVGHDAVDACRHGGNRDADCQVKGTPNEGTPNEGTVSEGTATSVRGPAAGIGRPRSRRSDYLGIRPCGGGDDARSALTLAVSTGPLSTRIATPGTPGGTGHSLLPDSATVNWLRCQLTTGAIALTPAWCRDIAGE